jgi:hypothetical protein
LNGYVLSNSMCKLGCEIGFFANELKVCTKCKENCYQCSSSNNCNICNDEFNLFNNSCLSKCPIGMYSDSKICLTCS